MGREAEQAVGQKNPETETGDESLSSNAFTPVHDVDRNKNYPGNSVMIIHPRASSLMSSNTLNPCKQHQGGQNNPIGRVRQLTNEQWWARLPDSSSMRAKFKQPAEWAKFREPAMMFGLTALLGTSFPFPFPAVVIGSMIWAVSDNARRYPCCAFLDTLLKSHCLSIGSAG